MPKIIHLNLSYENIEAVLNDLNQIAYKDTGTENLITQLEQLKEIEESMCISCHYNIDNNCPIHDIMDDEYQCSYYEGVVKC